MPRWRSGRGHRTIEHLRGRENSLEPFGWTGRKAEWVAPACLHGGGLVTRAQLCFQIRMNRWQAFRFIRALVANGFAAEDSLQDRKVCRIFSRPIFQALSKGTLLNYWKNFVPASEFWLTDNEW